METRQVLGLDDLGREIVRVRTSDSRGIYATEIVIAFADTGHCEIVSHRTLVEKEKLSISAQGQPNRKLQPNRGPIGRKDWK